MKKVLITLFVFITTIFSFIGVIALDFYSEKQVNIPEHKDQYVLFYDSDCKDCKQLSVTMFNAKNRDKNLTVVNLNNLNNRKYIDKYGLTSVPTLIHLRKDGTYKTYLTDSKEIKNVLKNIK